MHRDRSRNSCDGTYRIQAASRTTLSHCSADSRPGQRANRYAWPSTHWEPGGPDRSLLPQLDSSADAHRVLRPTEPALAPRALEAQSDARAQIVAHAAREGAHAALAEVEAAVGRPLQAGDALGHLAVHVGTHARAMAAHRVGHPALPQLAHPAHVVAVRRRHPDRPLRCRPVRARPNPKPRCRARRRTRPGRDARWSWWPRKCPSPRWRRSCR